MASTKVVTRQKLTENLAQIFANIETGNLTHAERIFQRAWRSNRPEMQLMVDARLIHKFINVSSER
jgi:Flp pilus assembly protein TadD